MSNNQERILPSLVSIRDVETDGEHNFTSRELEALAELIQQLGGCIIPIIVKKIHIDRGLNQHYKLIEGRFILEAAKVARKRYPLCETINAFIIDEGNEDAIMAQVEWFFNPLPHYVKYLQDNLT